jgi:hypothetical protein
MEEKAYCPKCGTEIKVGSGLSETSDRLVWSWWCPKCYAVEDWCGHRTEEAAKKCLHKHRRELTLKTEDHE